MVQFNTPAPGMPIYVDLNEQVFVNELTKTLSQKQTDERGYFVQYFTKSTKKPYVWEKFDSFNSIRPDEYGDYFKHCKINLEHAKAANDYSGIRIVAFSFDCLNPLSSFTLLKQFCYEEHEPKVKTYINGQKANSEFLAKKGKMFTTKAGV